MKWLATAIVVVGPAATGAYVLVASGAVKDDKKAVCVEYEAEASWGGRDCIRWEYR